MILLNGTETAVSTGATIQDIVTREPFSRKKVSLIVFVDGHLIRRENWASCVPAEGADVRIRPLLRGG